MKYRGIDFANRKSNIGNCFLTADEKSRILSPNLKISCDEPVDGTAVDCPFGTTAGFKSLLDGKLPGDCEWDRGFKTRATEDWLRSTLWDYRSNSWWRSEPGTTPQHYVNKNAHVQSAVGLVIVPSFLHWFLSDPNRTQGELVNARRGEYDVVEAHPRPFLYSAIERIFRAREDDDVDWKSVLRDVVSYKDKRGISRALERKRIYEFLARNADHWLWDGWQLADAEDELFVSDHGFDAYLAAMTIFAHRFDQTIHWEEAARSNDAFTRDVVEVEGHILILSQS